MSFMKERRNETSRVEKTSRVGDHLLLNPDHTVNWEILINATKEVCKRKILEAF